MRQSMISALIVALSFCAVSCNKEWTDEQFANYISFKAPITGGGVTQINVKFKESGKVTYRLPVIVSGTTTLSAPIQVHTAVDSDTLRILNVERFHSRTDLYYRELDAKHYEIENYEVTVPADSCVALLDIDFKLAGLDLVDKYVLPLTIADSPDHSYQPNMRKHYRKALLWVTPFNDYSGSYSATTMEVRFSDSPDSDPMVVNARTAYVVDDRSVFFYAGVTDEQRKDRRSFKITATFRDDGTLALEGDPQLNLTVIDTPTWEVEETMDAEKPYLKHRYVTMRLKYEYDDSLESPGYSVRYRAEGIMTMERKINTQIPDEDQAIEW